MSRSKDALQVIKAEIESDVIYTSKSPAEVAILMMRKLARDPVEYDTFPADKLEVMRRELTQGKVDAMADQLVVDGDLSSADLADVKVEIKDRKCDLLHLGDIKQGDIEAALALP